MSDSLIVRAPKLIGHRVQIASVVTVAAVALTMILGHGPTIATGIVLVGCPVLIELFLIQRVRLELDPDGIREVYANGTSKHFAYSTIKDFAVKKHTSTRSLDTLSIRITLSDGSPEYTYSRPIYDRTFYAFARSLASGLNDTTTVDYLDKLRS